jgi:hypothetical protein
VDIYGYHPEVDHQAFQHNFFDPFWFEEKYFHP